MSGDALKAIAKQMFQVGIDAADPARAVKRALDTDPVTAHPAGRVIVIAIGKASHAMMTQALQHLPDGQAYEAIAVPNYENAQQIAGCRVMAAGHPLPDENGLAAGRAVMDMVQSATGDDHVLCLISGGGSALLPTPRGGMTLADKIRVNEVLLAGGLDITQMNHIRQQLSVLKGGGLTDMAFPASVRSLIISDVVGDDVGIIASGPTANMPATVDRHDIWGALPATAQTVLQTPKPAPVHRAENTLICTNGQSLAAIAEAAADWTPHVVAQPLIGDVEHAARDVLSYIQTVPRSGRQMIIWGGETTVMLTGTGRGGRNQELALRFAMLADDLAGDWVFLSGGTDGRDGPTDAAGGIVTSETMARARALRIDVGAALGNNDSYGVLQRSGDLLRTGATGTNVADVQIFMRTCGT